MDDGEGVELNLKRRLAILAVMWLFTIASALIASNIYASSPTPAKLAAEADYRNLNFKTMTVAVCERTASASVYCHDEIKVICGDKEYILPKSADKATCGNLKIEIPSITAFAVFDKEWEDLRVS